MRYLIALYCGLCFALAAAADQWVVSNPEQKELPPAQLGIAPPTLKRDLVLSEGALNESVILYNYDDKPKIMQLSLIDTNAQGGAIAPSDDTLAPRIIINPTTFTIAPGAHQTVRLSVRLPAHFAKKTYYARLLIKQQIDHRVQYDQEGQSLTLSLGSSYGLPIVINVR